jgi:hypothetical protein
MRHIPQSVIVRVSNLLYKIKQIALFQAEASMGINGILIR